MSETEVSGAADFLRLEKLTLAYGRSDGRNDGRSSDTNAGKGEAPAAVPELDLSLREGELLALLGPSGCGKTTTMRAIAGLLAPRAGRIVLAGRDITRVSAHQREVGLVFQSYALFPHLSVHENVAFGLRLRNVAGDELQRRVGEAIDMVGLGGFERRLPRELSGGQQQRVALARSVVVRPRLLLLDEPLSNLDARLRLEMRSELQRLQRELGVTMLYVTHDQSEALALADRVVVMREGRIAQQGAPQAIYERPRTAFVARFVGFENVFAAPGTSRDPAGHDPAAPADTPVLAPWIDGQPGLAWRPRHVLLGQGPHEGRVLGVSYLGESMEVLIESAAGAIKAQTAPDAPRHGVGEMLRFDLPLAAAVALEA